MPRFSSKRRVNHSAQQMFDLVADVERYPEFVPLCRSLKIRHRTPKPDGTEIVVADMTVSFKLVREAFTSRVTLDRPNLKILVEYLQGPFSNLENRWTFEPKSDTACDVGFFLAYEFKSRMLALLMGTMFDTAFQRFAAAFEKRADAIYGSGRSAGTPRLCPRGTAPLDRGEPRGSRQARAQPADGFAARLGQRLRPAPQFRQHTQGFDDGALAHRATPDGSEAALAMQNSAVAGGDGEVDEPYRFSRRRSSRTGNAGNRDRQIDAGFLQRADGHRGCGFLADRAEGRKGCRLDTKHHALGVVGIGDKAAVDDVGRSGNIGERAGDQAAGAGFRGRNRQ